MTSEPNGNPEPTSSAPTASTGPASSAGSTSTTGPTSSTEPATSAGPISSTETTSGAPVVSAGGGGSSDRSLAAMTDLAGRLGVGVDAITTVRDDEVTWPDSSLGCPRPGFNYQQVLTPGHLIVLDAAGQRYEYHAKAGGPPFLCERPTAPVPGQ